MQEPREPQRIGLIAVNVGRPARLSGPGDDEVLSAIVKTPVPLGTTLAVSTLNLAGDAQADLTVHGGPDKAVYAYPSEHLGPWSEELGEPLAVPSFGENLSTVGVTEGDVGIGDRWRWGGVTLQVCQPRWPCFKLALHLRHRDIQARMRANGRTGWYLRVVEPGTVTVGDDVEVIDHDPAAPSVLDAHLAMGDRHLDDPSRARALADHPALAAEWRDPLVERLGRAAG